MAATELIRVEVIYALPDEQTLLLLELPLGSTAMTAIEASGVLQRHSQLSKESLELAVFGRKQLGNFVLQEGDRVEILRPLVADPKDQRRQRVQAARKAQRQAQEQR